MQCIRARGGQQHNDEEHLDRIAGLSGRSSSHRVGTEFSFYLHKVQKARRLTLSAHPGVGLRLRPSTNVGARIFAAQASRPRTLDPDGPENAPETGSRLAYLGSGALPHTARGRHNTAAFRKLERSLGFLLSSLMR